MTNEEKLIEILNHAILGVKKHRNKNTDYDKGRFHAFQDIRNKWHELNEHKALGLAPVVGRSEQLCQHDRSVTNRICDDCGSVITYMPDDELA